MADRAITQDDRDLVAELSAGLGFYVEAASVQVDAAHMRRVLELAQIAIGGAGGSFQSRVDAWLLACFGETIARDREERNHRFLEEAVELVTTTCEMLDHVTRFGERLRYLQFRGAQIPAPYADWRASIPTEFGGQGCVDGRRIGMLAEILGDPMRFSRMTIDFTPDGRMAVVVPDAGGAIEGYGLVTAAAREAGPTVAKWFGPKTAEDSNVRRSA